MARQISVEKNKIIKQPGLEERGKKKKIQKPLQDDYQPCNINDMKGILPQYFFVLGYVTRTKSVKATFGFHSFPVFHGAKWLHGMYTEFIL